MPWIDNNWFDASPEAEHATQMRIAEKLAAQIKDEIGASGDISERTADNVKDMAMFKMTKAEALRIQTEHVAHYAGIYGQWVREAVAAETHAELLADGEHEVSEINRHIPRGGFIEFIIERRGHKTQASDWIA